MNNKRNLCRSIEVHGQTYVVSWFFKGRHTLCCILDADAKSTLGIGMTVKNPSDRHNKSIAMRESARKAIYGEDGLACPVSIRRDVFKGIRTFLYDRG